MSERAASLVSVAMAFPHASATQQDLASIALQASAELRDRDDVIRRLYEGTKVSTRGVCVLDADGSQRFFPPAGEVQRSTRERIAAWALHASEMGVRAGADALKRGGVAPHHITHVITASCTGFTSPGIDQALIEQLGIPPIVQRVHVGFMGCHAMINALRVARAIAISEPDSVILVVAAEVCSVHFQHEHLSTDRIIANALFADGAGACVVAGSAAKARLSFRPLAAIAGTAATIIPGTRDAMSWTMGDHGFVMSLSKDVPAIIEREVRGWLGACLDSQGLALADIRSWCVHPGGPRVLESVQRALGLPADALEDSHAVLREHGNMSSPTVLAILERRLARDAHAWPCVMLAFGPGLTAEAAVMRAE